METSPSLTKIAPALVTALAAIKGAAKDSKNPHFRNDYASLESVIEASRDVLAANGLCAIQALGEVIDGRLTCTTRLLHTSGEWVQSTFHMRLSKDDPQGTGSTATYARRYALMAALNVAPVDDDAEADSGRQGASNGYSEPIAERSLGVEPEGKDFWHCTEAGLNASQAKKAGLDVLHETFREQIGKIHTREGMREWIEASLSDIKRMPRSWRVILRADCEEQAEFFGSPPHGADAPNKRTVPA